MKQNINTRITKLENIKLEEERVYPSGMGSVYSEIHRKGSDLYELYKPNPNLINHLKGE